MPRGLDQPAEQRTDVVTSLTIVIGFSVLCFSNFVPTILFGILVAVAMVLALVANLTLLPLLLVKFRPLG